MSGGALNVTQTLAQFVVDSRFDEIPQPVAHEAKRALLHGNSIVPLVNGDQAYPAMIDAIEAAAHSITLSTYIFDNDRAGRLFLDALLRAVARRVEVRVLVDDVGARYTWPTMPRLLRRADRPGLSGSAFPVRSRC